MRKLFFITLSLAFFNYSLAQDATVKELKDASQNKPKIPTDTIKKVWKTGGQFNLNINQGSLSNWSAGGDKFSFSLNSAVSLFSHFQKDKHTWDNTVDLAYGIVNTSSLGNRKSNDRIDILSKYGCALHKKLSLTTLFNFRSQFAKGYSYSKNAAGVDSATLTSKGFAPMYVLLSLGLDYKPFDGFSVFVSPVTARWVIVPDDSIKHLYSISPDKSTRKELGAFLSATFNKDFSKKFNFKSRLDLFSNYNTEPENIDVFWSNILSADITKYIKFNISVDLIYDDNTLNVNPEKGPAPQIMQQMGIGFSYRIRNYKS